MQAKLSLFVGAPLEKAGFFVGAEVVEGAANEEVASTDAVRADMEVMFIRSDIIVAACPKDIAGGVDNRALAGVIWANENIETWRELQLQWSGGIEAPESARVNL
ncbi:hypothetical protein NAG74_04230 [Sinorhizobium meliloti]|nr:hypothetical protein [Sinorhizobium meliloti]MCO5961046.1 hypothetical protein [Sinorhizobium meliloti]